MRLCLPRVCLLAAALFVSAKDAAAEAPNTCALWPMGYWEDQTIYYAEFHETCQSEPMSAFLIGDYDWPLECGSDGCQWEREIEVSATDPTRTTRGIVLTHKWIPRTDEFVMPAGPARRFSRQISRTAVSFDHDDNAATPDKFAYVYLYNVNPSGVGGTSTSKFMKFGFEALEAPDKAPRAKVTRRILNSAVHLEHEGTTYVVQLRS